MIHFDVSLQFGSQVHPDATGNESTGCKGSSGQRNGKSSQNNGELYSGIMKKLISYILLQPGNSTKFDHMEDDGWVAVTRLRREYSISQYYPKAQALAAIPRRHNRWTRFGNFIMWKILTDMELMLRFHQLQIQRTHLTLLYPEKQSVFVNEFHDHKEEIRSSSEFLTELQGSVKSEPCEEKRRKLEQQGNLC